MPPDPDWVSLHSRDWTRFSNSENHGFMSAWFGANLTDAPNKFCPIFQPRSMKGHCLNLHNQWLAAHGKDAVSAQNWISQYAIPVYQTNHVERFPALLTPDWPNDTAWLTLHCNVAEWQRQCFEVTGKRLERVVYGGNLWWFFANNPVIAAHCNSLRIKLPNDFAAFGVNFMLTRDESVGKLECLLLPEGNTLTEAYRA